MTEEISGVIFGVWFLIGAALVFWMQAGFAMVEAGFTEQRIPVTSYEKPRWISVLVQLYSYLIGFSLLLVKMFLVSSVNRDLTSYILKDFDWSNFVFNPVFLCTTTATIVPWSYG